MNTWWKYAVLAACLILAALLRLYGLGDKAFWLDEIIQINLVLRAENLAHLLNLVAFDPVDTTPPLSHVIQHLTFSFGKTEFLARLPSAIFGVLTILLLYVAATRWFSSRVGILSTLLMTVSVFHIEYSQEGRAYSLFTLLALLSLVFFYEQVFRQRGGLDNLALLVLTLALTCYAHFFGVLVIAGLLLSWFLLTLIGQDRWRRMKEAGRSLWLSLVVLAFAIAPAAGLLVSKTASRGAIDLPGPELTFNLLWQSLAELTGANGILLFLVSGLLLTGALIKSTQDPAPGRFALAFSVIFPALVIVALKIGHSLFNPRYLIPILPLLFLLIATGIDRVAQVIPNKYAQRTVVLVIALLIATGNAISLPEYYNTPKRAWRAVVQHLAHNTQQGDIIVLDPAYLRYSLLYYLGVRDLYTVPVETTVSTKSVTVGPAIMLANAAELSQTRRVWYIVDRGDLLLNQLPPDVPSWVAEHHELAGEFPGALGTLELYVNDQHRTDRDSN